MQRRIVIIGAGQAGITTAAKLRQMAFEGPITLFGNEAVLPYQRPPLNKAYLLGKLEASRLSLRTTEFYTGQNIDVRADDAVIQIERDTREVVTKSGRTTYDDLVIATGASPVTLPACMTNGVGNIFYLRNKADADRLRPHLEKGKRMLVIGGGYIGLEVAAAARQTGMAVSIVETAPRILARVAAEPTAAFLKNMHTSQGVDIREGVGLSQLGADNAAITATLSDGQRLTVDVVVVGIGVRPNVELAERSGLLTDNGILVNDFAQTSDPAIWAAGDVASFMHNGETIRIESVPHAIDQAEHVAMNIMGERKAYRPRPWFWSDQYSMKLQIAGLNRGYDRAEATPGANENSLTVSYYKGETLIAADCLNDARSFMVTKRQLGL